jgi:hypothetical protein
MFPRTTIRANLLRLATEALSTIATTARCNSHAVSSALKRVGDNEARGKLEIAPRPDEVETSASCLSNKSASSRPETKSRISHIIFRVHIEERNMLNPAPIWILADRSHVRHPDACAVVGLEHDPVGDIQVVINGLVIGALEGACPLGLAQVGQVDDMGDGDSVCDHAFDFVELVVQEHELVPVALGPPALVCVCGSGVLEATEHLRVGFVGRVPDGDRVFVVGDADVAAVVAAVGAVVGDCYYCLASVTCRDTIRRAFFSRGRNRIE